MWCSVMMCVWFAAGTLVGQAVSSPVDSIDPFIGTTNGGDTFPGPSLPFGMMKPGPDTGKNDENGGWGPEGEINGFSQTHVSGTGGGASSGNILIAATTGALDPRHTGSLREEETATAGYYGVRLTRFDLKAEIATAARAAVYRFTFPAVDRANLIVDVSHCLSSGLDWGEAQSVSASTVTVLSPTEMTGSSSVRGGWNKQPVPYTVFFYLQTDTPALELGTFRSSGVIPYHRTEVSADTGLNGAYFTLRTKAEQQVRVKIGISYISVEQARRNAEEEIAGFDFDGTVAATRASWAKAVSAVEIAGATAEQRRNVYTALYHTMLMPVDRTGENPLWTSKEPYFDDFYTVWDTFRTSTPLLTLIAPEKETRIVRAMVDIYRYEGWVPDGRQGNYNGRIQGGTDGDVVLADGYVKGLPGIDWKTAYEGLRKDAEVSPADQFKEGRGGLEDWKRLGYLTVESVDRPGSKHMEYALNDFAVAEVAEGLGKIADAARYRKRAENWANLWDESMTDEGFTGFIRPRHRDGSWRTPFTTRDSGSFYQDTFYEGDSWTYSLFVPQDVRALVAKAGGSEVFAGRLDAFFKNHFDITNEPGFLTPYLYLWSATPWKTAEAVHRIVTTNFRPRRSGLPGNDDSGAMSSLYIFHTLGFFPNAGQDVYFIGTPLFSESRLHLGGGKTFTVRAENLSQQNIYVVGASLNGKPLDRAWFRHGEIAGGGTLVLTMSGKPGAWPAGPKPPSMSDPSPQ